MKKTSFHISKSTLLAIVFFGIMALTATATAQNDTVNPLVATTGPNVLGEGRIQWNSSIEYLHDGNNLGAYQYNSNSFGLSSGFRFGIGKRAELTFDIAGRYNTFDTVHFHNTTGITPSVGAKLLLYEGRKWLPQTSFYTSVSNPIHQNAFNEQWSTMVQPQIGFQFRNRLGKMWMIDYSLGYSWNRYSTDDYIDFAKQIDYSLHVRRITSKGNLFSIGISNRNSAGTFVGDIEERFQISDNLQAYFQVALSGGYGSSAGIVDRIHVLAGLNWMLK